MDTATYLDLEDTILRRTIHISNVPHESSDSEIVDQLHSCGEIEKILFDRNEGQSTKMAFVQFKTESGAAEAMRLSLLFIRGERSRITQSRMTIDVIPPTDAVFGKPLTVGRHVMSVNPSVNTGLSVERRERSFRSSCQAAAKVLEAISSRSGWEVPAGELDKLMGRSSV